MRSPASNPAIKGPASYIRLCCAVLTQTACPCPTSSTHTCACPSATTSLLGLSIGKQSSNPASSGNSGRGNNQHSTPSTANSSAATVTPLPCQTGQPCANQSKPANITVK